MPTISKGDKVLVTGANGYIAVWLVRQLLEKGYAVRGTVRSEQKGEYVKNYLEKLGLADKFELFIVEDIEQPGAFDEAVKGVDAIAHTSSPFHQNPKSVEDFYGPAVQGTTGILASALKNAPQVKRIVITSSTAAVINPRPGPATFSEADWNDAAVKEVEELGMKAHPMIIYRASKTLAERSAWKWYDENKDKTTWDISFINPPFVFGPPIQDIKSPAELNTSLGFWWSAVVAEGEKPKDKLSDSNSWIDVRDAALAHILALENEAAGNERIIVCEGPWRWQDWVDIANSLQPAALPGHQLSPGHPEITQENPPYKVKYDTSKEKRVLDIPYKTKFESTKDMLEDFAQRGW